MHFQESHCRHNEARHAKGALEALFVDYALLHGVQRAIRARQSFYGQDFLAVNRVGQNRAGVVRHIIKQHGAGTALGAVTTEFGASQSKFVAKSLGQRFLLHDVDAALLAVDVESDQALTKAWRLLAEHRRASKQIGRRGSCNAAGDDSLYKVAPRDASGCLIFLEFEFVIHAGSPLVRSFPDNLDARRVLKMQHANRNETTESRGKILLPLKLVCHSVGKLSSLVIADSHSGEC